VRECRVAASSPCRRRGRSGCGASRSAHGSQAMAAFRSRQPRSRGGHSGPSGGRKSRRPFAGRVSGEEVCAALWSRRRRLRRSGMACAPAATQSGNRAACTEGPARQRRAPVVGSTAPSTAPHAQTGGTAPPGGPPGAGGRRRPRVRRPTRRAAGRHRRPGRVGVGGEDLLEAGPTRRLAGGQRLRGVWGDAGGPLGAGPWSARAPRGPACCPGPPPQGAGAPMAVALPRRRRLRGGGEPAPGAPAPRARAHRVCPGGGASPGGPPAPQWPTGPARGRGAGGGSPTDAPPLGGPGLGA
jgi:hypothetical protein